jgi:hypothetical protein
MTGAAWLMLGWTWAVIIALTAYTFFKVLTTPTAPRDEG